MATTQRRGPAHAKKSKTRKAGTKATSRTPAKRTSTKRAPAKRRTPSTSRRSLPSLSPAALLGRPAPELAGLGLVVVGLVAALGIWFDLTGPVGRLMSDGAAAAFGWAGLLLPVVLCGAGAALLQDRSLQAPAPTVAGYGLLVAASTGILHLFDAAGGGVGRLVGGSLEIVLAQWGALIVLVGAVITAFLVITDTPASTALGYLTGASRAAGRLGGRGLRALGTITSPPDPAAGDADQAAPRTMRAAPSLPVTEPDVTADLPSDGPAPADDDAPEAEFDDGDVDLSELDVHVPGDDEDTGAEQLQIALGPAAAKVAWKLPPTTLLKRGKALAVDQRMVDDGGRTLERALQAHGVETRLVGATVGPTVTRYELELGEGVKVAKVTSLVKDIAYAMAAADVRLLAPIPGRSAIGVEVPNRQRQLVSLGDILATEEAHKATHPLEIGLGRDIGNRGVMANMAEMPHILIAGATGAGKSSCINSIVTSILMRATPDQVRLILIDPKRVELGQYNHLPHLLTQVVVNPKKAANALAWAVHEMERRYDLLFEVGVRDVTGYNAAFDRGELGGEPGIGEEAKTYDRLPFILIVVDELNDLMMVAARDVEESICRIAQMARAVGIHLVIATQRPSVDVITGVIKANVPSRLAFAVSSMTDSKVILDQPGAEKLTGKGDLLLLAASSSVPRRIQGAWVGEDEVRKVAAFWRRQSQPNYVEGVEGDDSPGGAGSRGQGDDGDDDEMLDAAMELVVRSQLGSTSMLQRKLRVGFARAGRLMDLMERRGVVGPGEGSKARAVLMTVEELEEILAKRG